MRPPFRLSNLLLPFLFCLTVTAFFVFAACSRQGVKIAPEKSTDDMEENVDGMSLPSEVLRNVVPDLKKLAAELGCTIQVQRAAARSDLSSDDVVHSWRGASLTIDDTDPSALEKLIHDVEKELANGAGQRGARLEPFEEMLVGDRIVKFQFRYSIPGSRRGIILGRLDIGDGQSRLQIQAEEW